ncbi:hypothetical protein SDC9_180122 [bioreactor metagenome]|uniref:Uncharacterized protein n=1 Tax=bioreactor metagenome TaxID=1076179 RepID=A0A645H2V5_9ZZZZ|nr:hypothetical protein [Syntrophomonadaceae bacterium]
MTTLYRRTMVLGILILVICGLNISNQGMNSLTLQDRKPVVGLQTQGDAIRIYTLGQSHNYDKEAITGEIMQLWDRVRSCGRSAGSYVLRMVEFMRAYIFS